MHSLAVQSNTQQQVQFYLSKNSINENTIRTNFNNMSQVRKIKKEQLKIKGLLRGGRPGSTAASYEKAPALHHKVANSVRVNDVQGLDTSKNLKNIIDPTEKSESTAFTSKLGKITVNPQLFDTSDKSGKAGSGQSHTIP